MHFPLLRAILATMLKRFISYYGPHKWLFALDISCAILSSILAIFFPFLTRELLGTYIPDKNMEAILITLVAMFSIYIVSTSLTYIRVKWGHVMGVRIEADMRKDIFAHIQKLSFSYFDRTKTGHLMSRISNDLNVIAEVAHHSPEDLLISLVVLIISYAVMFTFSVPLALISLIPLPFMLVWGVIMGRRMRQGFRRVRKQVAEINSTVENSVMGIREVKSFANEDLEQQKFQDTNQNFQRAKEDMYQRMATFHSVMGFLREIYYFCVVAGGAFLIYQGTIEVVDLLAFILYVGIILPPINRLINFTEQMQQGVASFERFTEIMDTEPDIQDSPNAQPFLTKGGEIVFKNVEFQYDTTKEVVLNGISLSIAEGERVALVGESGAGKSTLVSLIPRFYEATNGEILIDGQHITGIQQESLRQAIGIVQQSVFLFDGTIRENILYGNPTATEDELWQAVINANLKDFVTTLPQGLDTLVGERGVLLSGGQKQRISIARVFLKNPEILILDEATSSLDNESESLIQEALWTLSQERTTIIIAHRLSTIINADRIYVMRNGKVVETGTHQELLAQGEYYTTLAEKGTL